MSDINVLYHSCPFDLSGYGTVARNHLLSLSRIRNLKIRLRAKKFWSGVSPDLGEDGKKLHDMERVPLPSNDFIFIQHLTPENFYIDPRSKYHICYTPFETDGAPLSWLLPLRGMDEIWVPSQHNKEAYLRAGVKRRVEVIPHGVDISAFNPNVIPMKYNRGKFNFGSIFDWTERKNPIALIRAYFNAFYSGEDVTLTIRTFWRFPVEKTRDYIKSEVDKIKAGYPESRKEFPKILFWFDAMDEKLLPSFYKSFDCFVLPTRGEGFGLPLAESMACGVPTIGPDWGGNREFMNANNSFLVSGNLVNIDNHEFLKYQPQYSGQRWFDINEEELSRTMRFVYDNAGDAVKVAQKGVEDIRDNFTWANAAGKIYKRLLEINS